VGGIIRTLGIYGGLTQEQQRFTISEVRNGSSLSRANYYGNVLT